MRVSWAMPMLPIGPVHKDVPDDEVLAFCEALIKLGFAPEVTHE